MVRAVILGLGLALGACGGLPDAVEPDGDLGAAEAGLVAGEAMAFEVRVAGILVGNAQLAVGAAGVIDGAPALVVTSRIASAGLANLLASIDDQATTVVDLATWRPITTTADATYGKVRTRTHARYAGARAEVQVQKDAKPPTTLRHDLGEHLAYDAHTAMAVVRTWAATPGETRELWLVGGRRLWRTHLTCVGAEQVATDAGMRPAVRFDGVSTRAKPGRPDDAKAKPRTFTVWLSDDADRVPLRVSVQTELGDAEIVLVDYQAGPR